MDVRRERLSLPAANLCFITQGWNSKGIQLTSIFELVVWTLFIADEELIENRHFREQFSPSISDIYLQISSLTSEVPVSTDYEGN